MKGLKRASYIIVIIIIVVLSWTIYANATKSDEKDQKEKTMSEIRYVESKIVNLLNSLNNIEFENYDISISQLNKSSKDEKSSQSEESGSNSSSDSSSSESGGGESEGGKESSGESSSSGTGESGNQSNSEKFELKSSGVLSDNKEINWDNIKSEVEILYSSMSTLTIDLYQLNLNQQDILSFNKELDNLTLNVKSEDKEASIKQLSKLYEYIPKFSKNTTEEEWYRNVLEVKSNIFKAYSNIESEDWDEIAKNLTEAINIYSKLLSDTSIDSNKQYLINKGYIVINELYNTVSLKDKEIFLIKYKNLLEELNNL